VPLVHSHHELGLQIPNKTSYGRQFKYYITIKNWKKEVHSKKFDSIIVKPLEGVPRSLGCTELPQAVHNTTGLLQT
jgi:hypothetical protein